MTGVEFLVILLIVLIVAIVLIFIFQTHNFMSLKSYHEKWKPIYENRIGHFDKHLKCALKHRKKNQSIEQVAYYAACMNWEQTQIAVDKKLVKKWYIDKKKDEYVHELRSANIE